MKTERDLKKYFVGEIAPLALKQLRKDLKTKRPVATAHALGLMREIIIKTELTEQINADSSKDVLKMLADGKISVSESVELMGMIGQKTEI